MLRRSPHATSRPRIRPLLVLLAVVGLQLTPLEAGLADGSAEEARPIVGLPSAASGAAASLAAGAELERTDRGGSAGGGAPSPRAGAPRATAHEGPCSAAFGPWLASDALDRAGRRSAPSTAPPTSPV